MGPAESRPAQRRSVLILLLALATLAGSAAHAADSDDTRAERDRVRAERAAAAAEIEPLMAEDAELDAALADLTAEVEAQQSKVDAARAALERARLRAEAIRADITTNEAEQAALRTQVQLVAVDAYIGAGLDAGEALLTAGDLNAATRETELRRSASRRDLDAVDRLRTVEAELETLRAEAVATEREQAELETQEQAHLADLNVALEAQAKVKAALENRIAEFTAEIDALDAAEADLTRLLNQQLDDEQRAAAAAAKKAADDAAAKTAPPGDGDGGSTGPTPPPPPAPPAPSVTSAQGMAWPTTGTVTSKFGPRWGRMHRGIDIGNSTGTPVYAAASGTVIQAGSSGGLGISVVISHGDGLTTIYGHHSEIFVSNGDKVSRGTQIGSMGCTGSCTGPHLHFETRVNGTAYDPLDYLP